MIGDDAFDDRADGAPADPQQPADRRERHLLGQPRDGVLEVARVVGARSCPRHRLHPDAAVAAAQQPQLAFDQAPTGPEIEVAPALDAAAVDLQPAGLAAAAADAPAAPQPDHHDDPIRAEADIDDGCPGQAEQSLECRGDAHVALLARPRSFEQPAACAPGGGASPALCATSEELLMSGKPCSAGQRRPRFTHKSTGDPDILRVADNDGNVVLENSYGQNP